MINVEPVQHCPHLNLAENGLILFQAHIWQRIALVVTDHHLKSLKTVDATWKSRTPKLRKLKDLDCSGVNHATLLERFSFPVTAVVTDQPHTRHFNVLVKNTFYCLHTWTKLLVPHNHHWNNLKLTQVKMNKKWLKIKKQKSGFASELWFTRIILKINLRKPQWTTGSKGEICHRRLERKHAKGKGYWSISKQLDVQLYQLLRVIDDRLKSRRIQIETKEPRTTSKQIKGRLHGQGLSDWTIHFVWAKVDFMGEVTVKTKSPKSETGICYIVYWQDTALLGKCPLDKRDNTGCFYQSASALHSETEIDSCQKKKNILWNMEEAQFWSGAAFLHLSVGSGHNTIEAFWTKLNNLVRKLGLSCRSWAFQQDNGPDTARNT